MEMDIFFSDESKEINPEESISIFTMLGSFFDVKSFVFLCFLLPNIYCVETQDFSVPLITQENSTLAAAPRDKVKAIWQRVDDLASLQDGWDGIKSKSINSRIIDKLKDTLQLCDNNNIANISVFPQANGNLYIDYTKNENIAGITLSEDKVIFFRGTTSQLCEKGTFEFSSKKLYDLISKLNVNV